MFPLSCLPRVYLEGVREAYRTSCSRPAGSTLEDKQKRPFVDYGATDDKPDDACGLKQWFGSIELKQVTKVLKIKY